MVTRYDFYYSDMWEEDDGNYVKYEDYAKLQAQLETYRKIDKKRFAYMTELQSQVDRVIKVRDWLSTQCTNSHAVKALDKAIKGEGDE